MQRVVRFLAVTSYRITRGLARLGGVVTDYMGWAAGRRKGNRLVDRED